MNFFLSLALTFAALSPATAQCTTQLCPSRGITNPTAEYGDDDVLCSVLATQFTDGTLTEAECQVIANDAIIDCCPVKQSPQNCFICEDASATFNAAKAFPDGPTCGTIDDQFSYLPAGSCAVGFAGFVANGFNISSYCECSNVVAPNVCKVCDDDQDISTTANIPSDEIDFTCVEGAAYASHFNTQAACAVEVDIAETKAACCVDKGASGSTSSFSMNSFAGALMLLLAGVSFA
ncbi:unnamed protein product [Cylindrotheca closterium]|uniref:Uncharacterized protein n=1 Tax=Cylindrotheca closterium TaxID=2856 RepID=A0AAD2PWD9_9STRA|nr:unnamed protein product [Cylindrotheca closterium]